MTNNTIIIERLSYPEALEVKTKLKRLGVEVHETAGGLRGCIDDIKTIDEVLIDYPMYTITKGIRSSTAKRQLAKE